MIKEAGGEGAEKRIERVLGDKGRERVIITDSNAICVRARIMPRPSPPRPQFYLLIPLAVVLRKTKDKTTRETTREGENEGMDEQRMDM